METIYIVDTWESGGEIDEPLLIANAIKAIFVRINDITGGHHMDANFKVQWEQAKNLVRVPYFVYNPWASGQANYDWLVSNMPPEAEALIVDVEVSYSGTTPELYAQEFQNFITFARSRWRMMIYTGEWFLDKLAFWPKDVPYWWAQYPLSLYPATTEYWSWEKLKLVFSQYTRPFNEIRCPGQVWCWQFTGDRLILPGCVEEMDVSAWLGTYESLLSWAGTPAPVPPPPVVPPEGRQTHPGIELFKVERFGTTVYVHIIDPAVVDLWVTGREDDFQQAKQTASRYPKAAVVTNGGGWPYGSSISNEVWKSKGTVIKSYSLDGRPWVGFTSSKVVFGNGTPSADVLDAVGYDRYLGVNGVFNEKYRNDKVKDARTFSGRRRSDGKFVLCVCEGNDADPAYYPYGRGLTFLEEWLVLDEFGVETGGNHDGGSSSQVVNKALSPLNLVHNQAEDQHVINAIVAEVQGEAALDEYRRLIGYNKGTQGDLNQTGICRAYNDCSGANWMITLNNTDLALLWKVNGITSADDPKWKWAIGTPGVLGSAYYREAVTGPVKWPYVVICSAIDGSKINQVHVLGYERGFYRLELIPAVFDPNISPDTHPWLFARCIAQSSDTPKGIFWMPLFSPVGRPHSTGGEGAFLQEFYVDGIITEVPPMTEFRIQVLGVPKRDVWGRLYFNPLNVRSDPSFGASGVNNTIGYYYRGATLTAYAEFQDPAGNVWYLVNKDPAWMCAYDRTKNLSYIAKL